MIIQLCVIDKQYPNCLKISFTFCLLLFIYLNIRMPRLNYLTCFSILIFGSLLLHLTSSDEGKNKTKLFKTLKSIIYDGLTKYQQTGRQMPLLQWAIDQLKIPADLLRATKAVPTGGTVCIGCAAAFKYFLVQSRLGLDRESLIKMGSFLCTLFNMQSERVCMGAINLNIDTFIYIAKEKRDLCEKQMCSIILQNYGCFKEYRSNWSVYIPEIPPNSSEELTHENKISDNFHRVLHITDVHVDSLYEPGSNAACDEPLCCQRDQGNATSSENAAGKWGDYRNCDMPYHSFTNLLEQTIKHSEQSNPRFSYVYFTGDIISHRVWDTSIDGNTQEIKKTYKSLKDVFGSIPVFPILGNHESHPANVFSPPSVNQTVSTEWLFDLVAEEWSVWLPQDTQDTIRYGGYYTVVVKPGFRIIALNSNVCYIYNWWLMYENIDPFYQLHWLSVVLAEAEAKKEAVHILSHIPPGDNTCLYEWSRQFQKIVQRFSKTIKAQFNGHTHYDELRVFYKNDDLLQPINIAYNGGSFTTFSNLNPNYRVYDVDSENYEVLDFEEWIYNMKEANANSSKSPEWYKLYSFKDAYGLESLKLTRIGDLINKMATNTSLLQLYHRFKVRDAEPFMLKGCDDKCLADNFCDIVTTEADDKTVCNRLLNNTTAE